MSVQDRVRLQDFNDLPARPQEKRRHSWIPNSLITLAQNPPEPPTIGQLLYPGKRTLLSGETESLKTWLALILAKAELQAGYSVAWVDLDDMGAGALLQRLRAIGVTDTETHEQFHYYQPEQMLYSQRENKRSQILSDVVMQLTTTHTRFMVIDAFNPFLSLHGLDMNSNPDIETVWREIAKPISDTGTCVCFLDHVVKNADNRGKYASGSERKASGATVHIGLHTLNQLTVGGSGRAVLTTHKDRPAFLPRPTIGILELTSQPGDQGETITYTLEADKSRTAGGFRPYVLMERISRRLELLDEPVTQTWVEENIEGNGPTLRKALTALTEEGYVVRETGPRNSHLYTTSNHYRADGDPLLDPTSNDPVPTPSHPVQKPGLFGTSTTPSTSPPLKEGRGGRSHDAPMDGVTENDRVHHLQNGHDGALPLELQPEHEETNIPAGLFNDSEPDSDNDLPAELQPQETT